VGFPTLTADYASYEVRNDYPHLKILFYQLSLRSIVTRAKPQQRTTNVTLTDGF